jgi:hypothetical protein
LPSPWVIVIRSLKAPQVKSTYSQPIIGAFR